jgi:hypothetical protein
LKISGQIYLTDLSITQCTYVLKRHRVPGKYVHFYVFNVSVKINFKTERDQSYKRSGSRNMKQKIVLDKGSEY